MGKVEAYQKRMATRKYVVRTLPSVIAKLESGLCDLLGSWEYEFIIDNLDCFLLIRNLKYYRKTGNKEDLEKLSDFLRIVNMELKKIE